MTQGDVMFLHRLMTAHKEVIREDCERRHLDSKAYHARIGKTEKRVKEILNRER